MEKLLAGKTAIITGGASGIGKASAEVFLREGAKVAVFDVNETLLKTTRGSKRLSKYLVDVRNQQQIREALKNFEAKAGPVDILVNNAGINPEESVGNITNNLWSKTLDINLTGTRNTTQIIGNRMIELGVNGSIVFVTSVHTQQAFLGNAGYDVSKHGMLGLMRVAAVEWAKYGIRCNAVAPGAIFPTGITGNTQEEQRERVSSRIPLGRWGSPQEIAETIVFVASERASYLVGAEIRVDGGLSVISPLNV